MQSAHEARPPRRSPFVAAFLSLLFPGLGHAYLGANRRAFGFAAPPILIGALAAGIAVRLDLIQLAGLAVQDWFITLVFVINLAALAYRGAAIIDAWRIARWAASSAAPAVGPRRVGGGAMISLPVAGLAAVLIVMSTAHLAVARYDLLLAGTTACIFDPSATGCGAAASPGPSDRASQDSSATPEPSAVGTPVPSASIPPWNGTDRLNVLLIGADEQGGGHNTDTMIVLSINPATDQVAMFQLPRDTVDVPVPAGPARQLFGTTYAGKINSFFVNVRNRPDLFPGTSATRGYNGLKAILGNLYGLDIKYFVEVNFDGFEKIIDAIGGVTINVQVPVVDDIYPAGDNALERVYIPSGMQHMNGADALVYARSRHGSTDFDRGARQQRVILSVRQQTDIARILPHVDDLAAALSTSLRTDIPRDILPQLLGLAARISTHNVQSYIFTPPYYQTEYTNSPRGYIIVPKVDRIRAAVQAALSGTPDTTDTRRDQLTAEAGTVYVLNGARNATQAQTIADYLDYLGIAASAPAQKPDLTGQAATTIRVYNGAETSMPLTVATLEAAFGVKAQLVTDPTATADIVVITGTGTPTLTPPPVP